MEEPVERVVVVAMVYFDASLKSTSRLYVERRRALDVLEEALTSKGGRRAAGSETLYIFDACVSRALEAVMASRTALEGIKTGFGVARGPIYEGEAFVAGAPVGVAARLCAQHGVHLSKPAADALDADHGLRTVPVFLQGSDSSGGLEEFCQVLC
jgi:class 3 adenylate cyclase